MVTLFSTAALCTGFLLDLVFGDPRRMPHIVRAFGALISFLERLLLRKKRQMAGGALLVAIMLILCGGLPAALLFYAYRLSMWAGFILESLLIFQLLAIKSLKDESMKVYKSLAQNDIKEARENLSMIVGRDTESLDEQGVARAAVESVAENTSDGVIAPMFYIALGGGALGSLYKAVNTMDSMIGYKNEKYLLFGRAAARLDDFMNYIPSRLSALLLIAGAVLCGYDAKGAYRIWRRDNKKHTSPNAGQTEAACAGALGIKLSGPAYYFGKLVEKPAIGDGLRPVCAEDIEKANKLMHASAFLMLALAIFIKGAFYAAL